MDDIRKSINSILYDRLVSPLSGTFLVSWSIINWKIPYATIFQTTETLGKSKIDFVQDELNVYTGIIWPTVSTLFLLTIYPLLSEYAYRISLYYRGRKKKHKNKYEESQLLTLEQSIEIRLQLKSQLDRFEKVTSDKDEVIASLKAQNEGLVNRLSTIEKRTTTKTSTQKPNQKNQIEDKDEDFIKFRENEINSKILKELYHRQPVWTASDWGRNNIETIKKLELLDLLDANPNPRGAYNYTISEKGKSFLKKIGL